MGVMGGSAGFKTAFGVITLLMRPINQDLGLFLKSEHRVCRFLNYGLNLVFLAKLYFTVSATEGVL